MRVISMTTQHFLRTNADLRCHFYWPDDSNMCFFGLFWTRENQIEEIFQFVIFALTYQLKNSILKSKTVCLCFLRTFTSQQFVYHFRVFVEWNGSLHHCQLQMCSMKTSKHELAGHYHYHFTRCLCLPIYYIISLGFVLSSWPELSQSKRTLQRCAIYSRCWSAFKRLSINTLAIYQFDDSQLVLSSISSLVFDCSN